MAMTEYRTLSSHVIHIKCIQLACDIHGIMLYCIFARIRSVRDGAQPPVWIRCHFQICCHSMGIMYHNNAHPTFILISLETLCAYTLKDTVYCGYALTVPDVGQFQTRDLTLKCIQQCRTSSLL